MSYSQCKKCLAYNYSFDIPTSLAERASIIKAGVRYRLGRADQNILISEASVSSFHATSGCETKAAESTIMRLRSADTRLWQFVGRLLILDMSIALRKE